MHMLKSSLFSLWAFCLCLLPFCLLVFILRSLTLYVSCNPSISTSQLPLFLLCLWHFSPKWKNWLNVVRLRGVCCCCCLVAKSCLTFWRPPWIVGHQAPLSVGFPRQEYWIRLPFSSPGGLPNPGIKPRSPALADGFFTTESPGKPLKNYITHK